jgi:hypothetical protein
MGIINKRRRIIAVGRSANGQPFQVVAPPTDFADAVAEVLSRPSAVAFDHDAIDSETVGAELCTAPYQW